MPINSQRIIKKIFLLSFSAVIVGSSVVFSLSILGNVCSQLISSSLNHYKETMRQQLTIPQ